MPGATTLIDWSEPARPGLGLGQMAAFRDAMINDAGHVAYVADASAFYGNGTGGGTVGEVSTVWSTRSGSPALVLRKDDLPGRDPGTTRFQVPKGFDAVRMDVAGHIAVSTTLERLPPGFSSQGVWHWDGSAVTAVAVEGSPAPAPLRTYTDLRPETLHMNRQGQLTFGARGEPTDLGLPVIARPAGGGDTYVVSRGNEVIGAGPAETSGGPDRGLNDRGQMLYHGLVQRAPGYGLAVREPGGEYELVARNGVAAPGLPGDATFSFLGTSTRSVLSGTGAVGFTGSAKAPADTRETEGLWYGRPGDVRLVAAAGNAAPGVPGTNFYRFGDLAANSRGDLAFVGFLEGADATYPNNYGLWVRTADGDTRLIVRAGDLIDVDNSAGVDLRMVGQAIGGPIVTDAIGFTFGTNGEDGRASGFAANGAMALRLRFSDGSEGIFTTAVPEPTTGIAFAGASMLALARRRRSL